MIRLLVIAFGLAAGMAVAEPLPLPDASFRPVDPDEARLGQLLFYDPILSGNKTVSCATCHHPRFATSDGVSLGIGDGGTGLGPDRLPDPENMPEQRIPRNSPALFNLGAAEFTRFFHDGRLEADPTRPGGIRTPLGEDMEQGFASALSAQSMFPVLSPDEMAGHYSENDVAQAVRQGFFTGDGGAWSILSARIEHIPEYRAAFDRVIGKRPITFADIANAIAAFVEHEWRADDSAFDRYLRGQITLSQRARAGIELFYNEAGCSRCHSGQFQTDHQFHAIAMPQFGPGKAARFERHARDVGRMRVTGKSGDAFAFRTPSLRNVAHTAPYGHSGAFATLEAVILHHTAPVVSLRTYDPGRAVLPPMVVDDLRIVRDQNEMDAIAAANSLVGKPLSEDEVSSLIAFLNTLSDETSLRGRLGIPDSVPSGLPVER